MVRHVGEVIGSLLEMLARNSSISQGQIAELKASTRKAATGRKARRDAERAADLADFESRKRAAIEAVERYQSEGVAK